MAERWQIRLAQYPILGLFSHNLLVLLSESGVVLEELDGLATSGAGRIKPVGYLPSDRLRVHRFAAPFLFQPQQRQALLFEGAEAVVRQRWQAAVCGGEAINALNLAYPFLGLGPNSNSVTSTLIACMGLAEPLIVGGQWAPWRGVRVLAAQQIAAIGEGLETLSV